MKSKVCYITYCSKEKNNSPHLLPSINRYVSTRIKKVYELSEKDSVEFRILSGKFGLLKESDLIPWYDHLLQINEVNAMVKKVATVLKKLGFSKVIFFYKDGDYIEPYLLTIKNAAEIDGIEFETKELLTQGVADSK